MYHYRLNSKNPNKYYPRIESVVIHKEFLKQIYDYLISIGLSGAYYLCKSKPSPRWKTSQTKYRFQFNGVENLLSFENLVGFINPKHKRKYVFFLQYSSKYDSSVLGKPLREQIEVRRVINNTFR
jgi:hypothetical protein